MLRATLIAMIAVTGTLSRSTVVAANDHLTFRSVTVQLPDEDSLFSGGSDADAINNNCLACHSTEMVLNQPPLPRATWEAEVHKMITVYKAPGSADDVAGIVNYLVKTKGKD